MRDDSWHLVRLGQFADLAADQPTDRDALLTDVRAMHDGWADLAEHDRAGRVIELRSRHDAALLALTSEEILALDDDARIALLAALSTPLAASGKAGLPLAERDHAWDASAADKRVRAWADATDAPNAKYAQAFFYKDTTGDGAPGFTDFKLGFADVIDGTLTAIPKGIFAVAGALQGARGGVDIPDSDATTIKGKVASYYSACAKKFDDPSIVPPWKKDSKNSIASTAADPSLASPAFVTLSDARYARSSAFDNRPGTSSDAIAPIQPGLSTGKRSTGSTSVDTGKTLPTVADITDINSSTDTGSLSTTTTTSSTGKVVSALSATNPLPAMDVEQISTTATTRDECAVCSVDPAIWSSDTYETIRCMRCGALSTSVNDEIVVVSETLVAAAAADGTDAGDERWHAIAFVEGVWTNDGRQAEPGSTNVRPLPLPIQYTTETTWGHDGAELGGRIETLMRDPNLAQQLADAGFLSLADGAYLLVAEGTYDAGENGQELRRLVNSQMLRFVSADLEILSAEDVFDVEIGDDGPMRPSRTLVTSSNMIGITACPFPAFQQCVICPASMSLFDAATQGMDTNAEPVVPVAAPVAVAAAGGPAVPPAGWFRNPVFGHNDREDIRLIEDVEHPGRFMCPSTITEDGRIYGHAAAWHRDHIGYDGRSVHAPRSAHDYAFFATGTVAVVGDDGNGDIVRSGVITMDTDHAPTYGPNATAAASRHHYDHTGTQIADVEIGEDEHGIWFAGALRADVPDETLRAFRAGGVSGDWRPIGQSSEMVGLLAVNVPGFPIPRPRRSWRVEGDEVRELALVAAGFVPPRDPMLEAVHREVAAQVAAKVGPFMTLVEQLAPFIRERQRARLAP